MIHVLGLLYCQRHHDLKLLCRVDLGAALVGWRLTQALD